MNDHASPGPIRPFSAILALAVCVLAGCATKPNVADVDWHGRIGNFTYDQSIVELGPPEKQTKLNGRTVAVWVLRRSGGGSLSAGVHSSRSSVGASQSVGPDRADRVLRLTFDAEGRLAACSMNY